MYLHLDTVMNKNIKYFFLVGTIIPAHLATQCQLEVVHFENQKYRIFRYIP